MDNLMGQADMTEATGLCPECSTPFLRKGYGPAPKYCSTRCRVRASNKRRKADGRDAADLERARLQREAERQAQARPCPYCDTPMTNPRRARCGAPDCERRHNAERMREMQLKHKAETGQWLTAKYAVQRTCMQCGVTWTTNRREAKYCSRACNNLARTYQLSCQECGNAFAGKQSQTKWCTETCETRTKSRLVEERRIAARLPAINDWPWGPAWCKIPESHPARARLTRPRIFVQGNCIRCGTSFCAYSETGVATYCSTKCLRSDSKAKRRALKRDAYVAHVYRARVFERDHWICQLCKRKVNRNAVVPHPDAPVIDHIIPLARGGTHEPANVQCAHYLCNSRKSHRGGGEQLLLIG